MSQSTQYVEEQLQLKTPPYLKTLLKDTPRRHYNPKELRELGIEALKQKVEDVIDQNTVLASRFKKRPPETLSSLDIAIILCSVQSFRNIVPSDATNEILLGLYQYDGAKKGTYVTDRNAILRLIKLIEPQASTYICAEVIADIISIVPNVYLTRNKYLIPVNNGVFNKKTQKLEDFSEELVFLVKLTTNYNHHAVNPIISNPNDHWDVESWIHELANNDPEVTLLLWQTIADAIQGTYTRGKAILFYSQEGNNGKGTFGQLIKNLLGPGNYASLAINQFKKEFYKTQLLQAIANISDENDVDDYIDSVRDFKASITGDDIIINPKYGQPFPYQFTGANIQMINGLPKTKDKTDSFYRRLLLVPFIKSFTNNGENKQIKQTYIYQQDVLEYVLKKALHLQFDEFVEPQVTQDLLIEYKITNNPVIQFWDEIEPELQWDIIPTQFLYDLFVSWYKRNNPNGKPLGRRTFIQTFKMSCLSNQTTWLDSFDKPTTTGNRMINDEPLITEYDLRDWMDQQAMTSDLKILRQFPRKRQYRGLIRL